MNFKNLELNPGAPGHRSNMQWYSLFVGIWVPTKIRQGFTWWGASVDHRGDCLHATFLHYPGTDQTENVVTLAWDHYALGSILPHPFDFYPGYVEAEPGCVLELRSTAAQFDAGEFFVHPTVHVKLDESSTARSSTTRQRSAASGKKVALKTLGEAREKVTALPRFIPKHPYYDVAERRVFDPFRSL